MKKILLMLIMIVSLSGAKGMHTAQVQETMNSGGYTYMKVSEGGKSYWIAASQIDIKKGSKIAFAEEMTMQQFQSKTLKRTFESIMFVSEIHAQDTNNSKSQEKQNIHVKNTLKESLKHVKVSPYKTKGTLGVAEAYKKSQTLKGKKVTIKGKVTKVAHMIMGKNWIHIQDGTGDAHSDDIVFTAKTSDVKEGDIVTAQGVLATDKDFGYGYFYPVIIEESTFSR